MGTVTEFLISEHNEYRTRDCVFILFFINFHKYLFCTYSVLWGYTSVIRPPDKAQEAPLNLIFR